MPDDPIEQMAERVAAKWWAGADSADIEDGYFDGYVEEVGPMIASVLNALSPQDAAGLAVEKGGMVPSCRMVVGDLMDDGGIVCDSKGRGKVIQVCAVCKDPDNPDWNERWPCRRFAGDVELRRAPLYRKADGRSDA